MVNHAGISSLVNARVPDNEHQCVDNHLSYTDMFTSKRNTVSTVCYTQSSGDT